MQMIKIFVALKSIYTVCTVCFKHFVGKETFYCDKGHPTNIWAVQIIITICGNNRDWFFGANHAALINTLSHIIHVYGSLNLQKIKMVFDFWIFGFFSYTNVMTRIGNRNRKESEFEKCKGYPSTVYGCVFNKENFPKVFPKFQSQIELEFNYTVGCISVELRQKSWLLLLLLSEEAGGQVGGGLKIPLNAQEKCQTKLKHEAMQLHVMDVSVSVKWFYQNETGD